MITKKINNESLRITEIFYSIQGETSLAGIPTVFIRLTGCPLRCLYCDTAYAFKGGKLFSINDILQKIKSYRCNHITVTGGEPLAQPNCMKLLNELTKQGYIISLETSGALDVSQVNPKVIKILDLKTPASGEESKNLYDNIQYLTKQDQTKFVICDKNDYEWAKNIISKYNLTAICHVLFSPSYQQQKLQDLADWILNDQLNVRLQVQLHKFIWGDVTGK